MISVRRMVLAAVLVGGLQSAAPLASFANTGNVSVAIEFSAEERALLRAFGPWPPVTPPDAGNELSGLAWAEAIGEKLFHDTRLSGSGSVSCASCHQAERGLTDGLNVAIGVGRHVRNTQGLLDVGLQRWFGWDGGTDSLWSATLRPLFSPIEMDADIDELAARFREESSVKDALSSAKVNIDALNNEQFVVLLSKAIAAHLRTLTSSATRFDQFRTALLEDDESAQQDYSDSAKRGLKIFLGDANCHVCHFGAGFSNGEFHDTGRPFFTGVGQVDSGRYAGIKRVRDDRYNLIGDFADNTEHDGFRKTETVTLGQANFGQWRTPSLRGLRKTAPYMHDGSLATLRDVVDAYADIDPDRLHSQGEAILKPLDLDEQARDDLVRFLESLSEPATP